MYKINKIIVTGGSGRFGQCLKNIKSKYKMLYPNKKELDITKYNTILKYLKKNKPSHLIHLAGLTRPMSQHEKYIIKSLDLNIIGTANIVKACAHLKIKIIYFSTNFVYPGKKGNYSENHPLLPINNYAWSKLGGESAVQMYKNSLILRVSMTEQPFIHKKAFCDFKTNFLFQKDVAEILLKLINKKGIINVGGKKQTVYNFVKKFNHKINKGYAKKILGPKHPLNPSINISKLKKILKN